MSRLFLTLLLRDVVHRIAQMKRFPCLLNDCRWNGTANPVLCFLNPHQIIFTYFSIAHTVKKTSFIVLSTTTVQVKGDGWNPLEPLGASKEVSKSKRNGADLAKSNRKVFSSHWGLHNKKHGKVCPQLPPIFPASTVLNAGIAGRHCGSNPLQSRGNGTNNLSSDSPAIISSTITEILFLPRRKCPTANIYLFPILPQFDHVKTHFATTNSFIYFQVQEFFS